MLAIIFNLYTLAIKICPANPFHNIDVTEIIFSHHFKKNFPDIFRNVIMHK